MSAVPESGPFAAFVDPKGRQGLTRAADGLMGSDGTLFRFLGEEERIVDFIAPFRQTEADRQNLAMYDSVQSVEFYRNFLDWLFATFEEDENAFRAQLIDLLSLTPGAKVLVTGCGLGDDIVEALRRVGPSGEVHAQDISKAMVVEAARRHPALNLMLSVSNGLEMPYATAYFDAVFHFGGINMFGDMRQAIGELARVCKRGGRVVFGDEGIAAHLRGTEYAKVAIQNNGLWALHAPMESLPHGARDVSLRYVLGNCFYVIAFTADEGFPKMNIDVPHQGLRGGSARTRYFGQLEGVSEVTKKRIYDKARALGVSVHDLLESVLKDAV